MFVLKPGLGLVFMITTRTSCIASFVSLAAGYDTRSILHSLCSCIALVYFVTVYALVISVFSDKVHIISAT